MDCTGVSDVCEPRTVSKYVGPTARALSTLCACAVHTTTPSKPISPGQTNESSIRKLGQRLIRPGSMASCGLHILWTA